MSLNQRVRITQLAKELELNPGTLLHLAREVARNGALISLQHLRQAEVQELLYRLNVLETAKRGRETFAGAL